MGLRTQKTCRNSPKPRESTKCVLLGTAKKKDKTAATTIKASKGNSIIRGRAGTK